MPRTILNIINNIRSHEMVKGLILSTQDNLVFLDIFIDSDRNYLDGKLVVTAPDFRGEIIFNYFKIKDWQNNDYKWRKLEERLEKGEIIEDKMGIFKTQTRKRNLG